MAQLNDFDEGRLYFQIHVTYQLSQPQVTVFYLKYESRKVGFLLDMKICPFFFFGFLYGVIEHVFLACPVFHEEEHHGGSINFKYGM